MDLNFKILADTFTELGFFLILVSLVYNYVNILLGLKIQHDLQCANFSLSCPNGIDTTSVASVCLHIASILKAGTRKKNQLIGLCLLLPLSPLSSLMWTVPATSEAPTELAPSSCEWLTQSIILNRSLELGWFWRNPNGMYTQIPSNQ